MQKVVFSLCQLPLKWIQCQVLTKNTLSLSFWSSTVLIDVDGHDGNK